MVTLTTGDLTHTVSGIISGAGLLKLDQNNFSGIILIQEIPQFQRVLTVSGTLADTDVINSERMVDATDTIQSLVDLVL